MDARMILFEAARDWMQAGGVVGMDDDDLRFDAFTLPPHEQGLVRGDLEAAGIPMSAGD